MMKGYTSGVTAVHPVSESTDQPAEGGAGVNGKVILYQFWESKSVPPPALDESQEVVVFPGFSF
jgi:hypothetical protein